MSTLKKIVIGLLVVVVGLVAGSYLINPDVRVARSETIDASPEIIFAHIQNLEKWQAWNPWSANDSTMKLEFGESVEGKGASYSWTSENSGAGKLTIEEVNSPQSMKTHLEFDGQDPAHGVWKLEEVEGGTEVTWALEANMGMNPISRYFGLFMDGMAGPAFEQGLGKLKSIAEAEAAAKAAEEKKKMEAMAAEAVEEADMQQE